MWVADRGFASAANRAYLTRGGGHYIHAEKLRHTNTEAAAAPARPGRYHNVADNLRVKEVRGGTRRRHATRGRARERFVICHNPEPRSRPAVRDQPRRPPAAPDRRLRHLDGAPTRRAGRHPQDQARAAPLPAPHHHRAAPRRPRAISGSPPGRQMAAAHLRPTLTPDDLAAAYKQLSPSNAAGAWPGCASTASSPHPRQESLPAHRRRAAVRDLLHQTARPAAASPSCRRPATRPATITKSPAHHRHSHRRTHRRRQTAAQCSPKTQDRSQ